MEKGFSPAGPVPKVGENRHKISRFRLWKGPKRAPKSRAPETSQDRWVLSVFPVLGEKLHTLAVRKADNFSPETDKTDKTHQSREVGGRPISGPILALFAV